MTRLDTRFMIIWVWELGDGLYYYVYIYIYIYKQKLIEMFHSPIRFIFLLLLCFIPILL